MDIKNTKQALEELKVTSENLKCGFLGMVLLAPQIIEADDLHDMRDLADEVASNFETCASMLYNFGRIGRSQKFAPQGMIDKENTK